MNNIVKKEFMFSSYVKYFNSMEQEFSEISAFDISDGTYEVSYSGIIRNSVTKKIISQWNSHGYNAVTLSTNDGGYKNYLVHRIVAETFIEHNDITRTQVNHKDGNKHNNDVSNLEWVTPKENIHHAFMTGLMSLGEDNSSSKITNSDADKICELLVKYDGDINAVMEEIKNPNITKNIIKTIRDGKSWLWMSEKYFPKGKYNNGHLKGSKSPSSKIDENMAEIICELLLLENGCVKNVYDKLKNESNISYTLILCIKNKCSWVHISDKYFKENQFITPDPIGENNANAKYDNDCVDMVCQVLIKTFGSVDNTYNYLNDLGFNISRNLIDRVKSKKQWCNISDKYFTRESIHQLRFDKIRMICESIVRNNGDINKTLTDMSDKIPFLTRSFIKNIRYKTQYSEISDEYFTLDDFKVNREVI